MSNYSCFEVNIKDGIAHLSMNRPDQLNSMTRIFWKELPEIIKNIDKNSDARVIVSIWTRQTLSVLVWI